MLKVHSKFPTKEIMIGAHIFDNFIHTKAVYSETETYRK